ncbi:MAG: cytochrome c oxidase accessory protein CcoG [Rhodoferax sp.]|nr:MAG: cytochrome c oxidase accessory protein CcoG [Rhodoferax sp.]
MPSPSESLAARPRTSPTTPTGYAEIKIYARATRGRFERLRWLMLWITQAVFYGLPWLSWNGRQAVLFDLDAQRFYLFNLVLSPQDLVYLSVLLILCALGLFFVTTLAGRIWCGFACPQTVYTKLFMWVELRTEGDRSARMRRDVGPWSMEKVARKAAKQLLWVTISLWTGFSFVAYFTPLTTLALGGWSAWESFWVFFYALMLYGNAGFLREQVCKHMCPYARFQSAMFDRDTLIIGYDSRRGDPRSARPRGPKAAALGQGDCIDCTLCVQVCPTGIDIRDGLQSNCIGCAACIDACDDVMDKIGAPRGLVRYATQNAMDQGWGRRKMLARLLRPRVLVYGALLLVLTAGLVIGLAARNPLKFDVIRDRGVQARIVEGGAVENVYRLHLTHTLERPQRYTIRVGGPQGLQLSPDSPHSVRLEAAAERWLPLALSLPASQAVRLAGQNQPVEFHIQPEGSTNPDASTTEASRFIVPQ